MTGYISKKENMLRLLKDGMPQYIPFGLEAISMISHRDARFYAGNGDPDTTHWVDAWGVEFEKNHMDVSGYPVRHPLTDIEEIYKYNWPDPNDPEIMEPAVKQIQSINREEQLVMADNPGYLFVRSWLINGMDNLLVNMLQEPEKAEYILEKICTYQEAIAKRYVSLGVDLARIADDAGTTKALMMHPDLWRKFIKPKMKRVIDIYKAGGCYIYFHCCGQIEEIIDDIIEVGVDILNPLQAGANDLELIRRKTQGKVILHGGIDVHTLCTAPPSEVAELTEKVMGILGRNGYYIADADQELPIPKKNYEAIKKIVYEKGRYPFK